MADKQGNPRTYIRKSLIGSKAAANLYFNEQIKALQASGVDVVHFGFGQSPFPVPDCMVKALQQHAYRKDYVDMQGIPPLRKAIVDFHGRELNQTDFQPDNIVVGPGSKELIFLTMKVFDGIVILPTPAWATYAPQAKLADSFLVATDTEKGTNKVTPGILERAIADPELKSRNKLLILTNPGNPTGTCYKAEELRELARYCRSEGIIVLSDEIYAALKFNSSYQSIKDYYEERTIVASGFSKWCGAGGWRVGYAHYPDELSSLRRAVIAAASHTYSCAPAPMQYALAQALTENAQELKAYLKVSKTILEGVANYCYKELIAAGLHCNPSEGGFYLMPDFEPHKAALAGSRNITTGPELTQALLKEANVALMPSSNFMLSSADFKVRFCFVCFDGQKCMEKYRKLCEENNKEMMNVGNDFVEQHCSDVARGVKAIRQWCDRIQNNFNQK